MVAGEAGPATNMEAVGQEKTGNSWAPVKSPDRTRAPGTAPLGLSALFWLGGRGDEAGPTVFGSSAWGLASGAWPVRWGV